MGETPGHMLSAPASLQGEPPLALGLSTRKALSVLKEQLEAVLEGHLREQRKCLTWKVGSRRGRQRSQGPFSRPRGPARHRRKPERSR